MSYRDFANFYCDFLTEPALKMNFSIVQFLLYFDTQEFRHLHALGNPN